MKSMMVEVHYEVKKMGQTSDSYVSYIALSHCWQCLAIGTEVAELNNLIRNCYI